MTPPSRRTGPWPRTPGQWKRSGFFGEIVTGALVSSTRSRHWPVTLPFPQTTWTLGGGGGPRQRHDSARRAWNDHPIVCPPSLCTLRDIRHTSAKWEHEAQAFGREELDLTHVLPGCKHTGNRRCRSAARLTRAPSTIVFSCFMSECSVGRERDAETSACAPRLEKRQSSLQRLQKIAAILSACAMVCSMHLTYHCELTRLAKP